MNEVIVIDDIVKSFGEIVALDGLSVNFYRGINGFLGPNGSGKTTTLKIIMGLLKPDSGNVSVLGLNPIVNSVKVREVLGYFPERDILNVDIEANKLVVHLGIVSGLSREEAVRRFNDIATYLDLGEEVHRPLKALSHGMRQKIKLAVALIHDPEILLLDEPTSGLDPISRKRMLELIKTLWNDLSISIVLSTHILRDVEAVCDRFVVINEGRKVYEGEISLLSSDAEKLISVKFIGDKLSSVKFIELIESYGYKVDIRSHGDEFLIMVNRDESEIIKDIIRASVEADVILRYVGAYKRDLGDLFNKVVN